jgi:hypothetical protein
MARKRDRMIEQGVGGLVRGRDGNGGDGNYLISFFS